ncbi:hypothetical protein [Acinetobacter larvae]|uniref:Transcriptional regulator SutA RNAP-binding domain-containing protein n=1 Tax=Acinetobacter larvae TaxID=1789224 RepID=A0A1B2M1K2_9GAMM|nr:hypothetical protein [Acinetobacter larvae]AOA58893.1 hypothetical protein BFG52_11370 [Acinetobacter larvae]
MTDVNDYDENEESSVDDDEAKAAEKGASDSEPALSDADLAEAESLTVTAKQRQRQALEDEIAAFLAKGGQITQVPSEESN